MSLSSLSEVFSERCNAKWTSILRWSILRSWSRCSYLIYPVAILMIVGVWRHSGTTKTVFELNRSEGKCGTSDAVFLHWTMRTKSSFEWFLDSDFQIIYQCGDFSNKVHNWAILNRLNEWSGGEMWSVEVCILQDTHEYVPITCHVFRIHLSVGWCHQLSPPSVIYERKELVCGLPQ